jgi:polyhydroxyalkanoate synthesis regulator phasin
MTNDDLDVAGELDELAKWGEGRMDRAARKILTRLQSLEADRDLARSAIQDLRQRVKALEDRAGL